MNAKKTTAIVVPLLLGIALIGTVIWGARAEQMAETYKTNAAAMYSRAYYELADDLASLELSLSKLVATNSHSRTILLLDDVWRYSGSCTSLLSQIPASHTDTADLNSFMIRVGDYCRSLTKKVLSGKPFSEEDVSQLNSMYKECVALSKTVSDRIANGDMPVEAIVSDKYYESSDHAFKGSDEEQKFPTLMYDGPFSEGTQKAQPKGLTGNDVTEDEAKQIANEFLGLTGFTLSSESEGTIPSYDFVCTLSDGRTVDLSVSKKGGHVVWLRTQALSSVSGIPDEEGQEHFEEAGKAFLESRGYKDMKASYSQYIGGYALINYCWTIDDAIVYNDLVKVWIDRESNTVIGFDARNYLFSHEKRTLDEIAVSEEEARSQLSSDLSVQSHRMAIIPITPQTESYCHEFTCKRGDTDYVVYICAKTGDELEIFKIIHTPEGTLAE